MPTTITLKNIPDDLYARLKAAALANRRSLNSEAIVRLEAALAPQAVATDERLARARALREALAPARYRAKDIDVLKRTGRS